MVAKIENVVVKTIKETPIIKIESTVTEWSGDDKEKRLDAGALNELVNTTYAKVRERAHDLTSEYLDKGLRGEYRFIEDAYIDPKATVQTYRFHAIPNFYIPEETVSRRDGSETLLEDEASLPSMPEPEEEPEQTFIPSDPEKILLLDFDGVIHSYVSGWQGVDELPDPIMPGAANFLYEAVRRFDVQIYSSRSDSERGLAAMQEWLKDHLAKELGSRWYEVYRSIKWPKTKPAAWLTIDDRCIQFTGEFPTLGSIAEFQPYRHKFPAPEVEETGDTPA